MKLLCLAIFCLFGLSQSRVSYNISTLTENGDTRIVGGAPTDILNYPYQASIQFYYRHLCGAALISQRWVLSAAHCTQIVTVRPPLFAFTVRLGSSFVQAEGQVFTVSRIVDHPGYGNTDNRFDYDITLLQLSGQVAYSNSIQPVLLPTANTPLLAGSRCIVTGWGALTQKGSAPFRLHVVAVPLISNESCKQYYRDAQDRITYSMLCAGSPYGGRDACQGDSGGPLVINNMLMGIVSWGYGCAQPGYPGVYANVPALRQWITDTARV